MRTTITLDEDVIAKIRAKMQKTGASFKDVVNEMLRTGLLVAEKAAQQEPFKVNARPLGVRPGLNYDCMSELLEQVEGPLHK